MSESSKRIWPIACRYWVSGLDYNSIIHARKRSTELITSTLTDSKPIQEPIGRANQTHVAFNPVQDGGGGGGGGGCLSGPRGNHSWLESNSATILFHADRGYFLARSSRRPAWSARRKSSKPPWKQPPERPCLLRVYTRNRRRVRPKTAVIAKPFSVVVQRYLINGIAKPTEVERFQPLAFSGCGQTDEEERLIVDGEQDDRAQPSAYLGPAQPSPKTVGRPSGTEQPPRNAGHL